MKQLYDELDSQGNIVKILYLVPGLTLAPGHRWVPHIQTLEETKRYKLQELEDIKISKCFQSVEYNGYMWQADSRSQSLLSQAILLSQIGAAPTPPTWRSLDNTDVPVTLDYLKAIAGTIASQTQQAYSTSWAMKALVNSATTIDEVDNILWPT